MISGNTPLSQINVKEIIGDAFSNLIIKRIQKHIDNEYFCWKQTSCFARGIEFENFKVFGTFPVENNLYVETIGEFKKTIFIPAYTDKQGECLCFLLKFVEDK
jgi:hypothetical protein